MKKILRHSFLLVILWGCSGESLDQRTLRLALETSPNKLDPALVVDVAEGFVCSMIFQGLVRLSLSGELVPDAAAWWEVLEDGRKYVFHLDKRMRFSSGRRLDASDVRFSFLRVLSPGIASPRKWVLDRIKGAVEYSRAGVSDVRGISAPDDSTLIIELEEPFRPFLMLLAMPAAMIVPREFLEGEGGSFAQEPVGSGRWQLSQWKRGDEMVLIPNEFSPARTSALEEIRIRIIPEAFTRIAEFESGQLDILKIPSAELARFLESPDYRGRIQEITDLRVVYIGLNNRSRLFGDVRVRKAMNMAVNVERIIEVLLNGQALRAAGAVPPALPGYRQREPYPFNPGEARRLLEKAGLGGGFSFELWLRDSPEGNLVCEAVQGYLKQIGVHAELVKREWSAFKEAVTQGKVDAFFLDWYADYPDAENFLFPLFHSQNAGGGGNRAFFKNFIADSLIELSQRVLGEKDQTALYASIDSLVCSEAPWIFLYFPKSFYAVSTGITGYRPALMYLGEDYSGIVKSN